MAAWLESVWRAGAGLVEAGGFAVPPLLVLAALLGFALTMRAWTLRRGIVGPLDKVVRRAMKRSPSRGFGLIGRGVRRAVSLANASSDLLRPRLEEELAPLDEQARAWASVARSAVIAAPLLGLLGTVSGMIETFESLGDMALFSQSGGIAGGIAEALLSTQVGLTVAVPGLVLGRLLERREARLRGELQALIEHVVVATQEAA